jgi:threonine aldolase
MRFLSAQLYIYTGCTTSTPGNLQDDLRLRNARYANAVARVLGDGLEAANEVVVEMPEQAIRGLTDDGFQFFRFGERKKLLRLVAAHNTSEGDARAFIAAAKRYTA